MNPRFAGKTVIITGASTGIGLLCAKCFASEGANVVLTSRNEETIQKNVQTIREEGGIASGFASDVRNYEEVERVCAETMRLYGAIDILINCAGGASARVFGCNKEFHEYPIEYLDWGLDVNLKGALYYARAAMARMVEKKQGCVLFLGSIAGEEGAPGSVDYAAAKSALMNGVVKSLAQNGAPYGIRVNTVSPGPVMTRAAMANMKTLLGRAAETQEIVDLILYLCSDQAGFITGANYMIDGGRSCMMP